MRAATQARKCPQRDLNSCYRRERAMSWAGLDDGDLLQVDEIAHLLRYRFSVSFNVPILYASVSLKTAALHMRQFDQPVLLTKLEICLSNGSDIGLCPDLSRGSGASSEFREGP